MPQVLRRYYHGINLRLPPILQDRMKKADEKDETKPLSPWISNDFYRIIKGLTGPSGEE